MNRPVWLRPTHLIDPKLHGVGKLPVESRNVLLTSLEAKPVTQAVKAALVPYTATKYPIVSTPYRQPANAYEIETPSITYVYTDDKINGVRRALRKSHSSKVIRLETELLEKGDTKSKIKLENVQQYHGLETGQSNELARHQIKSKT